MLKLKGGGKKPLSVLCKDLSMIGQYTSEVSNLKWVYKLLKATLPGPFTYIMPSSSLVPKMIIDRKHHKLNKWRRKEIGVRMPDDELCRSILDAVGEPLLSGSVPQAAEDELGIVFDASCDDGDGDDVAMIRRGKRTCIDTAHSPCRWCSTIRSLRDEVNSRPCCPRTMACNLVVVVVAVRVMVAVCGSDGGVVQGGDGMGGVLCCKGGVVVSR